MPGIEEIKDWYEGLIKTGSISDEKRKVLEEALAVPEVATYIKNSTMLRSDYSRNLDTLATERKAFESEKENIAKLQGELIKYKETNEGKYTEAVNKLGEAQNRINTLKHQAQYVYGIDLEDGAPPANGNGYVPPSNSNVYTQDQFNAELAKMRDSIKAEHQQTLQGAASELVAWTNQSYKLANEAQKLGITNYDPEAVWNQMLSTKNWDPRAAFDTVYNAGSLRQAQADAELKQKVDSAREEGRKAALAEAALPQARRAATDSYAQALVRGEEKSMTEGGGGITEDRSHVNRAADMLSEATGVERR